MMKGNIDPQKKIKNRLDKLLKSSIVAIIYCDIYGNVFDVNDAFLKMTGYTKNDFKEGIITRQRLTPPEYQEQDTRYMEKVLKTGKPLKYEKEYVKKDGRRIHVLVYYHPLSFGSTEAIAFVTDITKLKRVEKALLESESRFKALADTAPVLIWMCDIYKQCNYFNKYWLKFTGRRLEQELGEGWIKAVHPLDRKKYFETFSEAFDKREDFRMEYRLRRYDKKYRWILDTATPRFSEGGEFLGYIGSCVDISDQKEAKENLVENLNLIENLINSTKDAVYVKDLRGKYLLANPATKKVLGLTHDEEVIGKDDKEFLTKESANYVRSVDRNVIKSRKSTVVEEEIIVGEKSRTFLSTKGVYYDSDGKVAGLFGISRDISLWKESEAKLNFLSECSKILSSSLDYEVTLSLLAKLSVPFICDWCTIDILNLEGELELIAGVHTDSSKENLIKLLRQNSNDLKKTQGVWKVVKTGKSQFFPEIPDDFLIERSKNKDNISILKKLGFNSVMIVPLTSGNKTIGGITFVVDNSERKFTKSDLQLAEELAVRASLAIENSSLYSSLNKEKERINTIIDDVPGIVWEEYETTFGEVNRVAFVSNYTEKMLGYTVDDWISIPNFWLTIVHPDDRERALYEHTKIYQQGEDGVSRYRWITKDKKIIWVEAQSSVIKDERGNPIGMRGVTMNITDRMELERQKDEFMSIASHELKTPLTSIKAFTQLLQLHLRDINDKRSLHYLTRVGTQIDKLTVLVNDLLDVSKIQAGKLILNKEKFDIKDLIKETVEDVQAISHEHRIVIRKNISLEIHADRYRLGQVLTNLLSNAIKYSPQADKVVITVDQEEDWVKVSVKDYGIGIGEEKKNLIFDRFYRVQERKSDAYPGLGLGLYISKEIINRHGGDIAVKSKRGEGSTFTFVLPL